MTDVLRAEYSLLTAVPTAFSPAGETAERSDGAPVQLLCSTELLADAAGSRFVSFPALPHLFQVSCALHFGADQLSVPWPIILPSFTVYQVRLGSELTRAKSRLSIFVTR